ncbi:Peptidyl-prolyl cis-trans isomerase F-like 2 [Homarus americanus]|uniref:Peptidyl-prolyl cis-trans isomerase F-like 2 n=1 Tax=Homarus americanus TaxID=6706 RepID=A0A8J5MPC0_HOMAM|nr:Peptidyl-prolyl cis-trans isomerase F-like 2 [Homarus americanus]
MDDLLTCTVCCEQYHEKARHPVLLPRCGHSFCRPCVAFLVKNGCVICPSCRMDQRVETADHLPTEFSLLAITSVQQVTKRHDVKLSFWCKTCSEAACGECLFEDHPTHSHNVLKATTYIAEMKDSVTDITDKFMDALEARESWYHRQIFQCTKTINDAIRTISVLRKDMDDARDLIKGVKIVEGISPTTALSDASKCLGLKWNLKDCNLGLSRTTGKKEEKTAEEEKEKDESETKNKADDKDNDEKKKEMIGKEKEIEESETLTEEEKKKRKKMLRVKEKLALAAAAAEKSTSDSKDEDKKKKIDDKTVGKEKTDDVIEKNSKVNEVQSLTIGAARTKLLATKYAPVAREPSVTPEREVKTPGNKPSPAPDKGDKEELNKETSDNKEIDATKLQTKEETDGTKPKATEETGAKNSETATENESKNTQESPSSSHTCIEAADKQKEEKTVMKKEPATGVTKRPKLGRMARQALKRSQTMNFQQPPTADDNSAADSSDQTQSDNIKGLDLETSKLTKNEEPSVDNKDIEEQANSKTKTEERAEEDIKDEREQPENTNNHTQADKPMFEMEPEEKERIATELLLVPCLTVIVEGVGGRLAHVTWEPKGLHVYCHQYQELPYDVSIKWNVLHAFLPTKSPVVFLDVGTEKKILGRVYITLWGHLRRATNFLHLCLGDRGPSYRNTLFLEVLNPDSPGERIKGGDYDYNNGRGGEGLLDDLERQEGYSMPMEAGLVTAGNPARKEQDSQFYICTEDDPDRNFACPFGRVESGLYVMKEAVWLVVTQQVWIRDCGVVVDVPKF